MILESRSIIFSDEELIAALNGLFDEQVSDQTPASVVAQLNNQGEIAVSITGDGGGVANFESKDVGVAVLNHCIERGIPLPRGSYKELAIRGDHVALIVRLETGQSNFGIDTDEF